VKAAAAVLKYFAIAARCSFSPALAGGAFTDLCTWVCTSIATRFSTSMAAIIPSPFHFVMT
jgi:hypothetical protein